ncbi:MAG: hypothetical protein J7527_05845 [Chitinophagaceae bacterium]|nr:hypothetical protein [Chitinophagaceae bacterium]
MKLELFKEPRWPSFVVIITTILLLLFIAVMTSSCSVLKDKQSRQVNTEKRDTASVRTVETNTKTESGTAKESHKYEREEVKTPIILQVDTGKRDSSGRPIVNVYPSYKIETKESGTVDRSSDYHKVDSTRMDRIEQALSTLALTLAEQSKHKQSGTPWYVWLFGTFMLLTVLAIIYLIIRKR